MSLPLPYLVAAGYVLLGAIVLVVWVRRDVAVPPISFQNRHLLVALFAFIIILVLGLSLANRKSRSSPYMPDPLDDGTSCPTLAPDRSLTTMRTYFGTQGATVRGFPSTGGMLRLPFDLAVAEHLRLPRLAPSSRSREAASEDAFCVRLQLLGAKLWDSEDDLMRQLLGMDETTEARAKEMVVGWPSDGKGVWVLRADARSDLPRDLGKLSLCATMDERCTQLQSWGATFYEDPAAVVEFKGVYEQSRKK